MTRAQEKERRREHRRFQPYSNTSTDSVRRQTALGFRDVLEEVEADRQSQANQIVLNAVAARMGFQMPSASPWSERSGPLSALCSQGVFASSLMPSTSSPTLTTLRPQASTESPLLHIYEPQSGSSTAMVAQGSQPPQPPLQQLAEDMKSAMTAISSQMGELVKAQVELTKELRAKPAEAQVPAAGAVPAGAAVPAAAPAAGAPLGNPDPFTMALNELKAEGFMFPDKGVYPSRNYREIIIKQQLDNVHLAPHVGDIATKLDRFCKAFSGNANCPHNTRPQCIKAITNKLLNHCRALLAGVETCPRRRAETQRVVDIACFALSDLISEVCRTKLRSKNFMREHRPLFIGAAVTAITHIASRPNLGGDKRLPALIESLLAGPEFAKNKSPLKQPLTWEDVDKMWFSNSSEKVYASRGGPFGAGPLCWVHHLV